MAAIRKTPPGKEDADAMPVDRGMPLPLRILALVGALAFVLLGLNSLLPLLRRPTPQPLPLQPSRQAGSVEEWRIGDSNP